MPCAYMWWLLTAGSGANGFQAAISLARDHIAPDVGLALSVVSHNLDHAKLLACQSVVKDLPVTPPLHRVA